MAGTFSLRVSVAISSLVMAICILVSLVLLGFSWNRGLTLHDEGTVIMGGWRAWNGELPYRDFHYFYPPLTIGLTMASFQLFGVSVLAERILATLLALATIAVVSSIGRILKLPSWMIGLSILAYTVWGPLTYNFLWPTIVALNFSLWAIRFFLKKQFAIAGMMVGLAVLTKQNIGVALGVALLMSLFWQRSSWRSVFSYLGGGLIIAAGFLIWLISTGALIPFYEVMMYYMAEVRIGTQGWYIAFLNFGSPLKQFLKTLVYALPLTFPVISLWRAPGEHRTVAFTAFLLTLSNIYPLWDLVHVSAFFSLLSIVIVSTASRFSWKAQCGAAAFVIVLCSVGVWSTVLRGYYRWEAPLLRSTTYLSVPREGIFVDPQTAHKLLLLRQTVGNTTSPNDFLLVYHFAPMINFLLDRPSPSHMLDMTQNMVSEKNQRAIVESLSTNQPRFFVAQREPENWGNPLITEYLLENYALETNVADLFVWKRLRPN